MTRRRIAVIAASLLAMLSGSVVAASASLPGVPPVTASEEGRGNNDGDWACVHVKDVVVTYCQGDPLPPELPLPERPSL